VQSSALYILCILSALGNREVCGFKGEWWTILVLVMKTLSVRWLQEDQRSMATSHESENQSHWRCLCCILNGKRRGYIRCWGIVGNAEVWLLGFDEHTDLDGFSEETSLWRLEFFYKHFTTSTHTHAPKSGQQCWYHLKLISICKHILFLCAI